MRLTRAKVVHQNGCVNQNHARFDWRRRLGCKSGADPPKAAKRAALSRGIKASSVSRINCPRLVSPLSCCAFCNRAACAVVLGLSGHGRTKSHCCCVNHGRMQSTHFGGIAKRAAWRRLEIAIGPRQIQYPFEIKFGVVSESCECICCRMYRSLDDHFTSFQALDVL